MKTFQEVEKLIVSKFTSMKQYAIYGARILLIPTPLTVLFNKSSLFSEITSTINVSERIEINSPVKGKVLFSEKTGGNTDFSGLVYFIGCFLACLYGLETFSNKEYLKFTSTLAGYKEVFLFETFSRVILLNLAFLLCAGISFAWAFINGIQVFNIFILWYIIMTIALLNFFFSLGLNLSAIKSKINQFFIFSLVYIVLIYLIPFTIIKIISKKAEQITPVYQLEMEKKDVTNKFEKRALESQGKYTKEKSKTNAVRNLIESYWNGEFKQMLEIEERMIKEIEENAHNFQLYSMFIPTAFYKSVIFEISSRGFSGFLEYYKDTKEKDKQFMRLWLDKRYYSDSEEVESFIKKGDENIFYTKSTLPFTFWPGLLLTLFYSFLALVMAYTLNGKAFKIVKPKMGGIEFPKGQNAAFILCENDQVKTGIFNYYREQENAVCLEKIDTSDFNFDDVKPEKVFMQNSRG
ncbi:MAG: hypothetical protein MUF15_11550 [Acidobacteria bacterium]|nr:hypothetical protein [Acidobacteriota bacterium]